MEKFDEIKKNWLNVLNNVQNAAKNNQRDSDSIKIVAVSKSHPPEIIELAIKAGVTVFGENYAQELRDKHQYLEESGIKQPEWHFIGHLQSNKVKYIAPFVSMIHSVDSINLAEEISKQAEKNNRVIDILLQVNTSGEYSKFGCEPEEVVSLFDSISKIKNLQVLGLMTIGTFSDDEKIIRTEFKLLRELRDNINKTKGVNLPHLSMGMSHDYEIAIEEGATIVRIGTAIFGERVYY
ncbi:MAG: YggS family pyridoxal phosphate-dependent enzyme [Candidatus Kapabacteria bacterium]|nr:YggS family pyridoxal phosphate-dependent enzyme [Candidatus Kapabacteria bacterium]